MTCGQLKDYLESQTVDLSFDPTAELLGVVATHRELCIPPGTVLATLKAVFVHWADGNLKQMNWGLRCPRLPRIVPMPER